MATAEYAKMVGRVVAVIVILIFLGAMALSGCPVKTVPAGHLGVQDFFGSVSAGSLKPGINWVVPFTKVEPIPVRTQEILEEADVPSKEGLTVHLEVSLLYHYEPENVVWLYKNVGGDNKQILQVAVRPALRSAIREVTAAYEAKVLYSSERQKVAEEMLALFQRTTKQGITAEQMLLRRIALPPVVTDAISLKLQREQEAETMKFTLQKESQEAERKRIEAQGIADFQRIVTLGISEPLLAWKGIEATEKLAASPNAKIVIIGNSRNGLPLVLGEGLNPAAGK